MRYRVLVTDHPFADLELERFALAEIDAELIPPPFDANPDWNNILSGVDGILNGFLPITAERIQHLTRCRVIARYGIGVDNIDVAAVSRAGIMVTNVPDYCIEEVSTHVISLLLAANRKLFTLYEQEQAGGWGISRIRPMARLSNQVLGLIGYGRIGRAVAAKARALGLLVLCHDPYTRPEEGVQFVELETLLTDADYVSLHLPLTKETRQLMDGAHLALMKPTAYLINAARGEIVDMEALAQALRTDRLQGALLDVLPQEPPGADHPLRGTGAILTGHTAWYSEEALLELRTKAVRQVVLALSGATPEYLVKP